ncbi:hypothetical protein [Nodosilinea nodulosa]|uniref:hypothetical protein n=1 Tax=Nodosilinea nodulosa TaxID=416001 RepID=UPI0012D73B35|nr:hypothetical protein [Nodosilinea nodulosa]
MASQHRRAVGILPDRPRTASALQALNDSGFAMSHVSIVAKDPDRQGAIAGIDVKGEVSNQADTGGTVGAVTGGLLGGVTGLLVGLGTLVIPGIGPAMLAGEAAVALSTVVGGAAGAAAGGLVGALVGMGIPEHRAKHYRDRVAQGDYLILLRETEPEIARAERTLSAAGIEDWGIYTIPAAVPEAATAAASARSGAPNATFSGDREKGRGDDRIATGGVNPSDRGESPAERRYPQR